MAEKMPAQLAGELEEKGGKGIFIFHFVYLSTPLLF